MKKILFIFWIAIITNSHLFSQGEVRHLSLEDLYKSDKFNVVSTFSHQSMNDGESYSLVENDSLNTYSYKTGKRIKTLVRLKNLIPIGDSVEIEITKYQFSNDEKKVLFSSGTEKIYRYSSRSNYYIFDLDNSMLSLLSNKGKQQLASFSPDSKKIAFVRENNLYIVDLENSVETPITSDGKIHKIINGAPDWVYEEEFDLKQGYQWSPDGTKIAYYKFNEKEVPEFQMTLWGKLYPDQHSFKYPKAGENSSIVTVHLYDLVSGKTIQVNTGAEKDFYLPRIKWTHDPNTLAILWINRLQNELKILLADAKTGETNTIYKETNKYYIDITDDFYFMENGNSFILTSEQNGFNHIYLFDMLGNLEQQITDGKWDVEQINGIDEPKGIIYYTSSESSPLNRELYSIKLNGSGKYKLSEYEGNNVVHFSRTCKYYINAFSNANTPPVISVYNSKGKKLREIENNSYISKIMKSYNFSPKDFFKVKTKGDLHLNAYMIKPPDFNPDIKYPVLMYVYGGPGSQTVRNAWDRRYGWHQFLAQKGVIVVSVDNRGTGSRGEEFKKMTYLQLGKYETIDQIETAKYLGSLPYIDEKRIGVWGWSYGGFMALSCLTKGSEYFSMGMAVAPVSNWRFYDNIYTERFMRTPSENPEGYDENSPINHVAELRGDLLLVHGTADDNVHLQNTMDLISALVNANKQFDLHLYPNSNHGIYTGQNTTYHLYSLLSTYVITRLIKKAE
jgi:dipeptidyl-peptidase-4